MGGADLMYEQCVIEIGEKIDVAIAQLDHGEGLNGSAVLAGLRAKLKAAKEAR